MTRRRRAAEATVGLLTYYMFTDVLDDYLLHRDGRTEEARKDITKKMTGDPCQDMSPDPVKEDNADHVDFARSSATPIT